MTKDNKSKKWLWQRQETDFSFTRKPRIKTGGLSIETMCMLLKTSIEPISFHKFFKQNPIQMKKTFFKYVDYCLKCGFISKYYEGRFTIYQTTKRGITLIEWMGYN